MSIPDPSAPPTPPADPPKSDPPTPPAGDPPAKGAEDNYWKRQAEKHEKRAKELERAQMTEAEKAKAEREDAVRERDLAVKERDELRLQTHFEREALKAGVADTDLAFMAVDRSLLRLEDGKVVGLKQALEKLQKERPILFGGARPRPSAGGNPPGGNGGGGTLNQRMNDLIRGHR